MPFSLFSRKKPSRKFVGFYDDWSKTLTENCLPLLRQSLSSAASASVLSSKVDLVLRHLVLYYETLDLAADHNTVAYLLFPSYRNSLETPFLFLGDIHPYLLTNLLRSFINRENRDSSDEDDGGGETLDLMNRSLKIATAWKDPSDDLVTRIDQIECTMRLMVPVLMDRMRKAQRSFVARVSENWVSLYQAGKRKRIVTAASAVSSVNVVVEEAAKEEMEELVSIFVDANRLRKSVIMDIVGASSEHQAALFLEGLCQFLIGFKDQLLLQDFELLALPN